MQEGLVLPGHHVAQVEVLASTMEVEGGDESLEGLQMSLAEPREPSVLPGPLAEGTPHLLGVPLTDGALSGGRQLGHAPLLLSWGPRDPGAESC